ncbi:NAD(P)H-binding protein [Streptomyces sp. DH12]|uniref:NAD(P)H-binding protein n=1 Tax=Streptomyces sp. DH12 TaxID=2857010 RepID=UPI001E56CB85|nr:NAD(P)H-binding protein [Streptomyces sp. DH12]
MLLITGVSGGLGGLAAGHAAGRADVLLGTRSPGTGPAVRRTPGPDARPAVRRVDFDDPASLRDAFTGVRTLLLVSAGYGEDDVVTARHGAAIDAAERAGVRHVVYTSLSGDGDHLPYALPHRWTERRLRESTLAWTVLRNGLYAELLALLAAPDADGRITAPLGDGAVAAVARADLAEAAFRVADAPQAHAGRVYELVGEVPLGGADLAAAVSGTYEPGGPLAATRAGIAASGAAPFQVPMLTGTYSAIAHGFLDGRGVPGGHLRELLGRAPRPALDVYAGAVG